MDQTLQISDGPVHIDVLSRLRSEGHIVGICGNWPLFTQKIAGWHYLVSFIGPIGTSKAAFLSNLKAFIQADNYIMVGNDNGSEYDDRHEAISAGYHFIAEKDVR